jgi:replication factor C subunit 1
MLYSDKYKPTNFDQFVCAKEIINTIIHWLSSWTPPPCKHKDDKKALLLSGPPGVGKTSCVHLICKTLGYELIEYNASETRNKECIKNIDNKSTNIKSMFGTTKKKVFVFDEVDGTGGNADRGGISQLIQSIKTTNTPIICICNNRYSLNIKSLVFYCLDVRFNRPQKHSIVKHLQQICLKENLSLETPQLYTIVEESSNDIRQCLNILQMQSTQNNQKDNILKNSPFDACKIILQGDTQPLHTRMDNFYVDYALVPLLIQQNYIPPTNNSELLDDLAVCASELSQSDIYNTQIYNSQKWELLSHVAMCNIRAGHYSKRVNFFPEFTIWLGKSSTVNASNNKYKNLSQKMGISSSVLQHDYLNYIGHIFVSNLKNQKYEICLKILDSYNLSKDDMMEYIKSLHMSNPNIFDSIDKNEKSKLTRLYNQSNYFDFQNLGVSKIKTKNENVQSITTEDLSATAEEEIKDNNNVDINTLLVNVSAKNVKKKNNIKKTEKVEKIEQKVNGVSELIYPHIKNNLCFETNKSRGKKITPKLLKTYPNIVNYDEPQNL